MHGLLMQEPYITSIRFKIPGLYGNKSIKNLNLVYYRTATISYVL